MRASMRYFEIPRSVVCAIAGSVLAFQLFTPAPLAAQETAVPAPPASQGGSGGLVDIGGGAQRDLGAGLFGGGIDHLMARAALAHDP